MSGIMLACVAATGGAGSTPSVTLEASTYVTDLQDAPGTATAGFTLNNTGVTTLDTSAISYEGLPWCVPGSDSSSYEVYATLIAGTLDAGTTGAWQALSSNRAWSVTVTYLGSDVEEAYAAVNLQVRAIGSSEIIATGDVYLSATVGTIR